MISTETLHGLSYVHKMNYKSS